MTTLSCDLHLSLTSSEITLKQMSQEMQQYFLEADIERHFIHSKMFYIMMSI